MTVLLRVHTVAVAAARRTGRRVEWGRRVQTCGLASQGHNNTPLDVTACC